ncbi:phosphatase [Chryseolinea sp. H1M3-3]|uniref:phosphatase PAP2 family protein n=1 Tax=Chryseolinea sp. H1M3-3 TaxID=3034144 RepID=UPI0023ED3DD9|nr:phosphatase [Chryseolinea sp. H1M3-3]
MKKIFFVFGFLFAYSYLNAQSDQYVRPLSPSRGHYKDLAAYDPKSQGEEIDKQKFPLNAAAAERARNLKPYYLQDVDLSDFKIPNPPANSSEQTRAEINYLLKLQQQRSEGSIESSLHMAGVFYNVRIKAEDSLYSIFRRNLFFVGRSIGTWFNPQDLPLTADLIANVWRDASYFIWGYKYKYLRVRPYILEPSINNLENTNWAAYPSGHAANSYINAYIYQELAPEFTDVFLKDAYDMAHSREIIGVHYPSDAEASRILARQVVNKLFQNKKFLNDFEKVKEEWHKKAREIFARPQLTEQVKIKSTPSSCAKTCQ